MIPPKLSALAFKVFNDHINGKLHSDPNGNPWYYVQDLQKATDAVCEVALRWLQEKMDGKTNCGDNGNGCGCSRDS